MQVLHGFYPLARSLAIYNSENFRLDNGRRVVGRNICRAVACTALFASVIAVSLLNCWSCFQPELEWAERAYHLVVMLCLVQQVFIFTSMTKKNRQIIDALEQLQRTVDNRQGQSSTLYEQTEQQYSSYLDKASKAFIGAVAFMYVFPLPQPISYRIVGHPEPNEWVLPNGFSVPPKGYQDFFVYWLFLLASSSAYMLIVFRSVMYYVGICVYVSAMVDDLAIALDKLDQSLRDQSAERTAHTYSQQALANAIRFHNEIIDLTDTFGESMGEAIFYQMLFSAIQLASFMFAVDETEGMSPANNTAVLGALTVLLPTFLFCKLSENMTARLQMIGNAFYGCAWYCLGAKQQKLFLLPIQRAQKPFRMNGLGIVDCSLEIFSAIIRTASSYFLLLRSL